MVNNYKVDMVIKENKNNFWKPVDELHGLKPEIAVMVLNSKYSGDSTAFNKKLKSVLNKNVDSFINTYKEFFTLRKVKK